MRNVDYKWHDDCQNQKQVWCIITFLLPVSYFVEEEHLAVNSKDRSFSICQCTMKSAKKLRTTVRAITYELYECHEIKIQSVIFALPGIWSDLLKCTEFLEFNNNTMIIYCIKTMSSKTVVLTSILFPKLFLSKRTDFN